jgi:hypothetical protein
VAPIRDGFVCQYSDPSRRRRVKILNSNPKSGSVFAKRVTPRLPASGKLLAPGSCG